MKAMTTDTMIGLQHNPDGPAWDEAEEAFAERVDELFQQFRRDRAKVAEAGVWASELLAAADYEDMFNLYADLHAKHPADLPDSDLLARMYWVAKACHAAREERLQEMAEDAASREREDL